MVALICAACARRGPTPARPAPGPVPTTAGTPTPATPDVPTAPAATGRFGYLPGLAAYDVRTEAKVELTAGPDAERGREVVRSAARVGYALSTVGRGFSVAGQVDGYTVEASERVRGGSQAPALTLRFNGTLDPRSTRLYPDGPTVACSDPIGATRLAALAAAHETVIWVPATVTQGARWRDSVLVNTCRGPIPATVATVSQYEVTEANGPRIRVRRQTSLVLHGQAIVAGKTVTLSGTGSGETTIELDATQGRLVRSDGETRATVTVTLPDGARQFGQRVKTEVRRRDGT
jgi:hypothetical protein